MLRSSLPIRSSLPRRSAGPAGLASPKRSARHAGFTLIEMMIAVTLVSAIIGGLLMAMRTGLTVYQKITLRLDDNRRQMGLDQALHRQIGGMMPVTSECGDSGARIAAFNGGPGSLRFVGSF